MLLWVAGEHREGNNLPKKKKTKLVHAIEHDDTPVHVPNENNNKKKKKLSTLIAKKKRNQRDKTTTKKETSNVDYKQRATDEKKERERERERGNKIPSP